VGLRVPPQADADFPNHSLVFFFKQKTAYEMATFLQDEERPLLCLTTDQVEDHIDLLSQDLLELLLLIIDNPAGSDGVEVRLIVAACRGNDGGAGMRCQLHRIGAHSAGATMDQDRLSLFQVTVG